MPRRLPDDILQSEWLGLSKNWYAIYQWERSTGVAYTEFIANSIVESFGEVQLRVEGLRRKSFRAEDHRGQIDPEKLNGAAPGQQIAIKEKRFIRAIYNLKHIPELGSVIDYEVPLKETSDAGHGDIDLLCTASDVCFCVEAKKPKSGESILKSVLQGYVYTSLVSTERQRFLDNFGLSPQLKLTPAVLTFADAQSGFQLGRIAKYPRLLELIEMLNAGLSQNQIQPFRFFVVQNSSSELADCLTTCREPNDDVKVVFRDGFKLNIAEKVLPS